MGQTELIQDPAKFFEIVGDKENVITSIMPLGEEMMAVSYKKSEEKEEPLKFGNVALAAFVTATARLKLYEMLELLQERILYFDTDSVIFLSRPGDQNPPVGDSLGWTDELSLRRGGVY